jgi:pimeloyl-ACP methyl ester carboxylesterase
MTARLMRLILLVQLCAAVLIAIAAWLGLGVGPAAALLLGVAAVILVRMAISANNFLMSWYFGSPTPAQFKLNPVGRIKLFVTEFYASMLLGSWIMLRARQCMRVYPDGGPAVLLVHGYGCNSGYWTRLTPALKARRITHADLDLEPTLAGIDEFVPLVAQAVQRLRDATAGAPVIIVAHSMGGLVARAYLRAHGTVGVARVITLGTPHHGSALAAFGPGLNAAQMCRSPRTGAESDWLRALAASETPELRALFTSLLSHHDNIIAPQTSSYFEGARNIEFGGMGHVAMGRHPQILACVLDEIEQVRGGVAVA